MKKSIFFCQIIGFLFVSVAGTLLHFLYDWSNQNILAGLFSAINESIWEHMKLAFFPMVFVALVEYRFLSHRYRHILCAKLTGILFGVALIPVLYYSYTGILGVSADWFNITIFFLATGAAFWLETRLLEGKHACPLSPGLALLVLFLIGVAFWVFTFFPPHIPLFQDPVTNTYGVFHEV